MKCIDTQRQIMPFINNKLDNEQLEEFVNHVNICPNCMDELEVYYVLLSSMKHLDEDKELSTDFHHDLMDLLTQSEEKIFHDKLVHIRKKVILIIMISIVAVLSSFRIGEYVVEDVLPHEVKESNYQMEHLFHMNNKIKINNLDSEFTSLNQGERVLTEMITKNLSDIYVYLKEKDPDGAAKMEEQFGSLIWKDVQISNGIGLQLSIPNWTVLQY